MHVIVRVCNIIGDAEVNITTVGYPIAGDPQLLALATGRKPFGP